MKTAIVYSVAVVLMVTTLTSCYVLELSREKDQCQLFVLYEEHADHTRSVIWEDCHCGPGTGLARMTRRNKKRRLQEKYPSRKYSTYAYPYTKGEVLEYNEASRAFMVKQGGGI